MVKFEAIVVNGQVVVSPHKTDLPEGKKLTLWYDDRCRCVFVPGVLNPPRHPRPRVKTRCAFKVDHDGDHSWGKIEDIMSPDDEDDD